MEPTTVPPRSSVWMLASRLEDSRSRQFMALLNSYRIEQARDLALSTRHWSRSPLWLKHLGVALQAQGELDQSEALFKHALSTATDRRDICSALGNLGVVAFRRKQYERAHELALTAVEQNPRIVAPYTLGAAAAGKMRDKRLETFWARAIAIALPNLPSRPVLQFMLRDPDSRDFIQSSAWQSHIAPLLS